MRPLVAEMDRDGNVAAAYRKLQAVLGKQRDDPQADHGIKTKLAFSLCEACHGAAHITLTVVGGERDGLRLAHCLDQSERDRLAAFLNRSDALSTLAHAEEA
ncbi:MAG TPA: hypothetical protein VGK93_08220 [Candidatus Eisenbacteria bacterium]